MPSELLQPTNFIRKPFERYTPSKVLGVGRETLVVQARDPRFKKDVAIKIFSPDPDHHTEEAIHREAEIHAHMTPIPHVLPFRREGSVHIDDLPTLRGVDHLIVPRFPFIVSMLANRGSLEQALQHNRVLSGEEVIRCGVELFATLAKVHKEGFMHLDIKPGNLLEHEDDSGQHVLLADWGAAKEMRMLQQKGDQTPTKISTLQATPGYAPHEQLEGDPTIWSDVFSGGATIWTLLSGERPFAGNRLVIPDLESILKNRTSPMISSVEPLLRSTMAYDPHEREAAFGAVADVALALQEAYNTSATQHDPQATHIDVYIDRATTVPQSRSLLEKAPSTLDVRYQETGDTALDREMIDLKAERAREILGKDFLGVAAIRDMEKQFAAVGINVSFELDKLPPIPYSEKDLQVAKEMGEILVARASYMTYNGERRSLSHLTNLAELLSIDPVGKKRRIMGQDIVLIKKPNTAGTEEISLCNLDAEITDTISLGWAIVQKEEKDHGYEEPGLVRYQNSLQAAGVKNALVESRTVHETIWDTALYYATTGENALTKCAYTRTSVSRLDDKKRTLDIQLFVGPFLKNGINISTGRLYEAVYPSR